MKLKSVPYSWWRARRPRTYRVAVHVEDPLPEIAHAGFPLSQDLPYLHLRGLLVWVGRGLRGVGGRPVAPIPAGA